MSYEVELKYRIADREAFAHQVRQLGATLGDAEQHIDAYFNHPSRDFAQTDEALRIRRVGHECFLTYKGPKLDAGTKTRREIELPLGEASHAVAQWSALLAALGFRSVAEVRKTRRTATLSAAQTGASSAVELVLDEVERLGSYAELERTATAPTLNQARADVLQAASALGLAEPERRSYLEMVLASI